MFRTLDRYIIRQFLGTFFFILVVIMAIAVVFDVSEKTEDFAKMTATTWEVIRLYYVNFVIYYSNLFSGLLIFIAVMLFTSRLAHRTEIVAMLSSGVSFPRIMLPYFTAATFLTVISLLTNHFVLPAANKVRLAFEEEHIRHTFSVHERNIHRQIAPGTIVYFESYNAEQLTGQRFSMETWDGLELRRKLYADRARYDTVTGRWTLFDPVMRVIGADGDLIERKAELDTLINLKPADIGQRWETSMAMNWGELNNYIAIKTAQGDSELTPYRIEKHQRTSYPFATYVFTLIGVSIASRKTRGGTGLHLATGVLLALLYIFAMKLTTVAATNAGLDPFIAVWLPNLIFGSLGLWIYRNAPK